MKHFDNSLADKQMLKSTENNDFPMIDFIVPVFNEEQIINITYERLIAVASELKIDCNFIFIDDGSSDNTWKILSTFARKDERVKLIRFSRNFGHQIAITAGLAHSNANYSLIIDADLQDPPELVSDMLKMANSGYDIVYGVRTSRKGESLSKKFTANMFYRIINIFLDFTMPKNVGDFRLVSARARAIFLSISDKSRLNREIWAWTGLAQTGITYERPARIAGKSKYNFKRMLKLAFDGITSNNAKPLSIILLIASILFISSVFLIFINQLAAAIILITSIILTSIWLMGNMLAKSYLAIRNRPSYIIDKINIPNADNDK